jgi:tetratricopeptide (TPR) repeat protein
MELKIKPYTKNIFPLAGILVKNSSAASWLREMQVMQLSMEAVEIYPIPGLIPNSVWGCLIIPLAEINREQVGKNELCQRVSPNLFIPERSIVHPPVTNAELEKLFSSARHVMHPEFGLAELTEKLNPGELVIKPELKSYIVTRPEESVFIPKKIKSFQVKPVSPEEALKKLEENFPKKEVMKDKPLNLAEHGKLAFYKLLFTKKENTADGSGKTGLMGKLESFMRSITGGNGKWSDKMQQDFENLEERNQKEIDKLLKMLKDNPEEALKYAIPLDGFGSNRGGSSGQFNFLPRWFDFSLFGSSGSGGGNIDLGDHYFTLQNRYNTMAQDLIKQKEYQKAAFIYMKLLKDHFKAAETLEAGNYFQQAATIYLKYSGNKLRAAQCYVKGNMINEAIELYKELNENETVGDLYAKLHRRQEAFAYYDKVIEEYISSSQYVKASIVCRNKMENEDGAQAFLLEGWSKSRDAVNCLNFYLSGIHDIKQRSIEINSIYHNEVGPENREQFLQVIKNEYNRKNELSHQVREMAYEIIAKQIPVNPSIVSELKTFNINDKELNKDTIRFAVSANNPSKGKSGI